MESISSRRSIPLTRPSVSKSSDDQAAVIRNSPSGSRLADPQSYAASMAQLRRAELSVTDLAQSAIQKINATEALGAWSFVDEASVLAAAREIDETLATESGFKLLHGLTFGVKDSIAVADMPFEAGGDIFRGEFATYDSGVVARLRSSGALPLGVNVMHALGLGDAVRYGHRATAHHPWNDEYVPSGSSSGSAVAAASGTCSFAVGGDTGGSVRGPAASCGVYGLKPTWGAVDASGTTPLAWSMDTIGFFARDVAVLERVCDALEIIQSPLRDPGLLRLGTVDPDALPGASDEMRRVYRSALASAANAGHTVEHISIPDLDRAPEIWGFRIAEFRAVLNRAMVIAPNRVPPAMRRVFNAAVRVSASQYAESWSAGTRLQEQVNAALSDVDALLLPATPTRTLTWRDWTDSGVAGSQVTG